MSFPKSQFTVFRILGLDWPLIYWPHLFNILGFLPMIEKTTLLALCKAGKISKSPKVCFPNVEFFGFLFLKALNQNLKSLRLFS
jgi:hypothetical protein